MQVIIEVDPWTPYACVHTHTCMPQCNWWGGKVKREGFCIGGSWLLGLLDQGTLEAKWRVLTCGHRLSIWVAAILTNFTPSSLLEMEQAKLATCLKEELSENWVEKERKKRKCDPLLFRKVLFTSSIPPQCNKVTWLCSTLGYHLVNLGMFTRRVDCQEKTTASRSSSIVYTSIVFKWRTLDMSLLCTSWICAHFLMSPKHLSFSKEYHTLDCIHPWFFQWKKCYMWWFALKRLIICQIKALYEWNLHLPVYQLPNTMPSWTDKTGV